jgi:hypothetical protein
LGWHKDGADLEKHRVIIGWLFAAVAMLLAVFLVFSWKRAVAVDAVPHAQETIRHTLIVAVIFASAASALLIKYRYSAWICLPFSATLIFYFPIGTLLGGYYLWYFWRYLYK